MGLNLIRADTSWEITHS